MGNLYLKYYKITCLLFYLIKKTLFLPWLECVLNITCHMENKNGYWQMELNENVFCDYVVISTFLHGYTRSGIYYEI